MKKLVSIIISILFLASVAHAQTSGTMYQLNAWKVSGTTITPVINTNSLTVPQLGGSGVRCIQTDNNGLMSVAAAACGSGSGGGGVGTSTEPFMARYFVATSSTDTSVFNGPMTVAGSIAAQGGISISSNSSVLNSYGLYFGNTYNTYIQSSDSDSDLYLYALDQITLEAASVSTNILSINTKIRTAAGSATAPAIGWASDDDGSGTGFYRNSANRIGVTINGNYIGQFLSTGIDFSSVIKTLSYFDGQLRGAVYMTTGATEGFGQSSSGVIKTIDSSGNITPDLLVDKLGAGTTTPWGQLSASSTSVFPTLAIEQKSTGPAAVFYKNSTGSTGISDVVSTATIFEKNHSTLGLAFAHDNVANRPLIQSVSGGTAFSMSINPYGGSVGIGTTTPFGLFSIKGAGTGTGKTMVVSDSSNNIIMSMLDNGRVKIGSTTPATTLFDVDGVVSSGADGNIGGGELRSYQVPGFYVGLKTDTTVNKSGLYRSNAGGDKFFSWYNTGSGDTGIATVGGAGTNIILFDNANEAMRIRNSMVSIGATKFPAHSLDVTQPAMSTAKTASYDAIKATNTATSSTASVRMAGIETIVTGTNSGTGASNVGVYVSSVSGGTANYDAIFNGGNNVGIATTSPWRKLGVAGTVGFDGLTGTTGAGSLCLSANKEVVYNAGTDNCLTSLRNTKHSIDRLDPSIDVSYLKPVSFVYNEGDGRTRYGFIAEDAADVDPSFATFDANGNLSGVDDRAIIAALVNTVQKHEKEIASLKQTAGSKTSYWGLLGLLGFVPLLIKRKKNE